MLKRVLSFTLITLAVGTSVTLAATYSLAQAATTPTNLISNPSVETTTGSLPANWLKDSWGTNSPTFTYQANGQDGTHSLSVKMSSYKSGDAKWYFNPVTVTAGHTYTYSDYYKATVQTYLVAQTEDANGNLGYFQIGNALSTSSAWKSIKGSFAVQSGIVKITIFHLINRKGTLQTDNFDLHDATPANVTNSVPNSSLEQISNTNPNSPGSWSSSSWGQNTATFTYLNSGAHTGSHAVSTQITSYNSGDAKWYYQPQPTTANQKYTFNDYYKSDITSRIVVEITNTDNTKTYIELKNAPAAANWTSYSDTFTTPAAAASLTVFHLISAIGTLTTDDYSLTSYLPASFNRALVTLTFDDGFASQYTTGKKTLATYKFPATFYITTGFLNSPDGYYMTDAMVSSLKNSGNQIADHTVTHPHLTTLNSSDVTTELRYSQISLQNNFGVAANDFASPYGDVNDSVMSQVRTYFRSHRGVVSGYNYPDNFDIYNLKVQDVLVTTTTAEVQSWVNQAAQEKSWLILVYHQVDNGGDTYSVKPTNFSSQMNVIKQSSLTVDTVDQAITELLPQTK
jgi:peptidoglycan/xylan/chitin deacetylase (PgdA/CDA1 family)